MTYSRLTSLLIISLMPFALLADGVIDWPEIGDTHQPRTEWLITGQPQPHELVEIARSGARHVVNARDIGEFDAWDEAELVDTLGMRYHRVPIGGPEDLDREAVETFDRVLAKIGTEPALMHCASGNRIGALFALRAGWIEGKDAQTAIEVGRAHGMTRLENAVREKLARE